MSDDFDDWKPMSDDFKSIAFNSYSSGQTGAQLPHHLLPQFGCDSSQPKRQQNLKLFIDGFPSDLTETGLRTFLKRIGCKLLSVKVVQNRSRLGRHFSFVDFENRRDAQRAIELIRSQNTYKLSVSFATTEKERESKSLLIDKEEQEFVQRLNKQIEMKQKIDLGNDFVINANNSNGGIVSPIASESESTDSSILDILSPLAKSDKLLKVLERPEDECSVCNESAHVEHLHYILREQQVLDPTQLPILIDLNISCLSCGLKTFELKLCSHCKTATYCSRKCQSINWFKHKPYCKPDSNQSFLNLNSSSIADKTSNSIRENRSENERKVEEKSIKTTAKPKESPKKSSVETPVVHTIGQTPKESTPLATASKPNKEVQKTPEVTKPVEGSSQDVTDCSKEVSEKRALNTKVSLSSKLKITPIERIVEREELKDGEEGVILCFGRNPFDFYLQKSSVYESIDILSEEINRKKDDFPQLNDKNLRVGSLCGGIYSVDGSCYRASIASQIDDQTYALEFVDYGNTEPVKVKDIKALPTTFFDCKAQAIHCTLDDIEPIEGKWNRESVRVFGEIGESNEYSKVKVFGRTEGGVYKIDLINKKGETVRNLLVQKKFATIPSKATTHSVDPKSIRTPVSSPQKTPQQSGDTPVIVQGSPKVVFNKSSINELERNYKRVVPSEDNSEAELKSFLESLRSESSISLLITEPFNVQEFQYLATIFDENISELMDELAKDFPSKENPINACVDDIVVAKTSEGEYCRSYILQLDVSTAKVLYIDTAFIENVSFKDIFKMPAKYIKYPVFGALLVPKTKDESILVELAATKEDTTLNGTLIKKDDKLYIKSDVQSIEVLGFKSIIEFIKTSNNKGVEKEEITDYYINLPLRQMELNKAMEVIVLYQDEADRNVFFIAVDAQSLASVMNLCSELSPKFDDKIKVNPIVGNVYLVRSTADQEWYRALINRRDCDRCSVKFIDFGNEEEIDSQFVMELSPELQLSALAPIALRCLVESTKLSAQDVHEKIKKATDGTYLLKVKANKFEKGFHFVKVY